MQLVERREFDEAYELLKKAEVLTDDGGCLALDDARRLRLSAVTFNNMGCFFKRRSKLHAALQYLFRALEAGAYTHSLQSSTRGPSGHIAHVRAQLEHLWATSTGTFGLCRGQSNLKLCGKGQGKLKLSRNGNEVKPLAGGGAADRGGGEPGGHAPQHLRHVQPDGQGLTLVHFSAQL